MFTLGTQGGMGVCASLVALVPRSRTSRLSEREYLNEQVRNEAFLTMQDCTDQYLLRCGLVSWQACKSRRFSQVQLKATSRSALTNQSQSLWVPAWEGARHTASLQEVI